jgi:hypothetical protein
VTIARESKLISTCFYASLTFSAPISRRSSTERGTLSQDHQRVSGVGAAESLHSVLCSDDIDPLRHEHSCVASVVKAL